MQPCDAKFFKGFVALSKGRLSKESRQFYAAAENIQLGKLGEINDKDLNRVHICLFDIALVVGTCSFHICFIQLTVGLIYSQRLMINPLKFPLSQSTKSFTFKKVVTQCFKAKL